MRAKFILVLSICIIFLSGTMEPSRAMTSSDMIVSKDFNTSIEGEVTSEKDGKPVKDALITVEDFGLRSKSNSEGFFSIRNIPMASFLMPVTLTVQAEGYEPFRTQDLTIRTDDPLTVSVRMQTIQPSPFTMTNEFVESQKRKRSEFRRLNKFYDDHASEIPIPQTIRVGITQNPMICDPKASYSVQVMDFKEYVKHVLPNEWHKNWTDEAYRAGAVAVKMYAWYWIERGGKWPGTDVIDSTCDQVYLPGATLTRTDTAVDFTWGWMLTRTGGIFQTQHKHICEPPSCMGQMESEALAEKGLAWDQILSYFYPGSQLDMPLAPPAGSSLHFDIPGKVAIFPDNIPGEDFTIEFWMKTIAPPNETSMDICGWGHDGNPGNEIMSDGTLRVSLAGKKVILSILSSQNLGQSGLFSLCGDTNVIDGNWHAVTLQRRGSDGHLWMFIDGNIAAEGNGPSGDLRNNVEGGVPEKNLLLGSSYSGWLDEIRITQSMRYSSNYSLPTAPFQNDPGTLALYHFDEGYGNTALNSVAGSDANSDPGELLGDLMALSDLFLNYTFWETIYLPQVTK